MTDAPPLTNRATFPLWARDTARYRDTDRQGHLNNAVFATFLESGRVAFLVDWDTPLAPPGCGFVIARLELDFRAEMHWGGEVDIGTGVLKVGRSSFLLGQAIFEDGNCTATAHTTIVMIDEASRKSAPMPDQLRAKLMQWSARPRTEPS
jgi:acyl-CoA thioester hydrolase